MSRQSRFLIRTCRLVAVALAVFLLAGCGTGQPPRPQAALPDFTALVKQVSPAVVNVTTLPDSQATDSEDRGGPLRKWFHRHLPDAPNGPAPDRGTQRSVGSGFIVSADGYILTNQHVVGTASQAVVQLHDRREYLAKVVGVDADSDVALLKIDAKSLPTVAIGDDDALNVGAWVVAIGSPFGLENSVTVGIVSGKHRSLSDNKYVPFIQTDTVINPGNSGGPLFNLKGEVVGMNSQIYSRSGGYQGLSFATPISVVMRVVNQLRAGKPVQRGWLGVQIQDINFRLGQSLGLERAQGALVSRVLDDSPAGKAGIKVGDVIIRFNQQLVNSAAALPPIVGQIPPGKTVPARVLRDGKKKTLKVTIGTLKHNDDAPSSATGDRQHADSHSGLQLENIDADQRSRLGISRGGVQVTGVQAGPAAQAGLRVGDVIVKFAGKLALSATKLRKRLAVADKPLPLLVERDGQRLYLVYKPTSSD